ncbi:hypothetical protein P5673_012766 [Acropora cervicornis]|uniref:Uncharacterized protein n=1 Tax=Acropora cervicornis TaxID=6130 RepID=A0AAD9V7N1_ACRCE|nr:hypothetical protein P5673_012766 [Acropora cervicornis]
MANRETQENLCRSEVTQIYMTEQRRTERTVPLGSPKSKRSSEFDASKNQPNLPDFDIFPSEIKEKKWGNISYQSLSNDINNIYDEIVHFRKNIFNILSGRAGKMFIDELTFWLKQLNYILELNSIALKAFMVLPSLILQKPSSTSKSKEHSAAIERRLALWKQGDLNLLMKEVRFTQEKFVSSRKAKSVEDISRIFARLVMQGKITAAIKLLDRPIGC